MNEWTEHTYTYLRYSCARESELVHLCIGFIFVDVNNWTSMWVDSFSLTLWMHIAYIVYIWNDFKVSMYLGSVYGGFLCVRVCVEWIHQVSLLIVEVFRTVSTEKNGNLTTTLTQHFINIDWLYNVHLSWSWSQSTLNGVNEFLLIQMIINRLYIRIYFSLMCIETMFFVCLESMNCSSQLYLSLIFG